MKLYRPLLFGMLACSLTFPLVSCGDDEPDIEKPTDSTIKLPQISASQVAGYTVKGDKVTVLLSNILATQGSRDIAPTSYSIVTSGNVISASSTGTSDNPNVALIEFDSSSFEVGYVDCKVNVHYSIDGGNLSKTVSLRLGIISAAPRMALAWQPVAWGGYDDVRVDPDGSTHIHNEPDRIIDPQWTEPASLVLDMGEKFTLPESDALKFHSTVTLIADVDAGASNLKWEMSDVKWLYDGVEFPDRFTFTFGSDENARNISATLIYKVKGEMDGVTIDETQRRPIQIELRR